MLCHAGKGDVTISMDDDNLMLLMTGQLNPQQVSGTHFCSVLSVKLKYYHCKVLFRGSQLLRLYLHLISHDAEANLLGCTA